MAVEAATGAYFCHFREVFSHNPLHDIESVWWVCVWYLLCHYHWQPSDLQDVTVQRHIKVVKTYGETLFNSFDPHSRRRALTGPAILANINPGYFPVAVQHFILLLDLFRDQLVTYYSIYNPTASQDRSFFIPDLHCKFSDIVEDAKKEIRNDETGLWLFHHVEEHIPYSNSRE